MNDVINILIRRFHLVVFSCHFDQSARVCFELSELCVIVVEFILVFFDLLVQLCVVLFEQKIVVVAIVVYEADNQNKKSDGPHIFVSCHDR